MTDFWIGACGPQRAAPAPAALAPGERGGGAAPPPRGPRRCAGRGGLPRLVLFCLDGSARFQGSHFQRDLPPPPRLQSQVSRWAAAPALLSPPRKEQAPRRGPAPARGEEAEERR